MKTSRLLVTVLLSLFVSCFVSCSKDDDVSDPVPPVLTYKTTFNVTLGYAYKVTDTNSGQVLVDVDYGVGDMNMFIYAIHRKNDGRCLKISSIKASTLQDMVTDNTAAVTVELPEGEYYTTFITFRDTQIPSGGGEVTRLFLEPLARNCKDAAMQVPNDYVHYATTAFEVSAIDGVNKPMLLVLEKMTTDLIFEFADADKAPGSDAYRLTVGVENIPSAFFIATGKTLTVKETKERGLYLYSGSRDVPVPAGAGQKAVVTTFHSLSNDNLPVSDRGKYWFEFKENFNGGEQIKAVSEELDEFSPDHSSSMYIYGLYDEEQPAVKSEKIRTINQIL